jgi:hypothetical protein
MLLAALLIMTVTACRQTPAEPMPTGNSAYYWNTDLRLDSACRSFMAHHDIKKLYVRYFDVVMGDSTTTEGPHPNATITFSDTLPPGVELVPTVYIMEDCMHERHERLATLLVKRIVQMNETNDIKGVRELQVDCDYTARSRPTFYSFLEDVRREARPHGMSLSVTVRLHQLQMPPPPADYGVLMLYNTGDPRKYEERNPILDYRDVHPYVRHLPAYQLPLAAAYPVYEWHRDINGVHVVHSVQPGEILRVKELVEKERPSLARSIVVYNLENENINRYSTETYEKIYHH